ncbi:MAG: hypothetical protein M1318_04325 [Firmicutes bacterium]|nr:hypothetical protein [Bacillota bacterium]
MMWRGIVRLQDEFHQQIAPVVDTAFGRLILAQDPQTPGYGQRERNR